MTNVQWSVADFITLCCLAVDSSSSRPSRCATSWTLLMFVFGHSRTIGRSFAPYTGWAIKTGHVWKFVTRAHHDTGSCSAHQTVWFLNFVKYSLHYSGKNHITLKITYNNPLFTVHGLRQHTGFYAKWSVPYIKTFNTLLRVRNVFQLLPQLDILCTSAVRPYWVKMKIHRSRVACFPRIGIKESQKTCNRVYIFCF